MFFLSITLPRKVVARVTGSLQQTLKTTAFFSGGMGLMIRAEMPKD
jgi:hypothetical protein